MLELTDLVGCGGLRVGRVRGVGGNERVLAHDCLAGSYDVVELVDAGTDSIRRLERAGLRCVDAGMVQEWITPAGGSESVRALQSEDGGDWALLPPGQEPDGLAQACVGNLPGASFWRLGDRTLLRRAGADETPEVTARPVQAELADKAVAAMRNVVGRGGRIRVPLAQEALAPALVAAGFTPGTARARWLMAPFLTHSVVAATTHGFQVTHAEVEVYGASSGDMNPLHFDDEFARSHGFKGRITHGMIFCGWLTRLLGTEYPGEGTIYLASRTAFLAPVYPETPYSVRISTPAADLAKGTYSILAQLRGEDGEVAALSYNDVLNRRAASRG
ncbi:MaoC/PaaZ C-terminal domain-containing protein [Luteimonas notoginsengisoli]|uniref:MaoC/PaaZ C-terminal domain-containing protein n=1 Tax=Luteimonas notoginsengisoli TaxID=1578200 RepID=A0ABV7UQ23_9GAMM